MLRSLPVGPLQKTVQNFEDRLQIYFVRQFLCSGEILIFCEKCQNHHLHKGSVNLGQSLHQEQPSKMHFSSEDN